MITQHAQDARRSRTSSRPCVRGKFLFRNEQKIYVRGATYGTFRPDDDGIDYPAPSVVDAVTDPDIMSDLMRNLGGLNVM